MKNRIRTIIADFGLSLWLKYRIVSATEIMMMESIKNRKCDHCRLSPIHYLKNCECGRSIK